jgi:hypothetical protein
MSIKIVKIHVDLSMFDGVTLDQRADERASLARYCEQVWDRVTRILPDADVTTSYSLRTSGADRVEILDAAHNPVESERVREILDETFEEFDWLVTAEG